jgi:16S rRNA (uracil1498-N3)-methyltransferase
MIPRFFIAQTLKPGQRLILEGNIVKHIQVLRLQPTDTITLFNGRGGEFSSCIESIGRRSVAVVVHHYTDDQGASMHQIHLLLGTPANTRMDWCVAKATELGVASITPLQTERSVLQLKEKNRIQSKRQHWQAIAQSACEQSGRNLVPVIFPPETLSQSVKTVSKGLRLLLSLDKNALPLGALAQQKIHLEKDIYVYSGPEGGFTPHEEKSLLEVGAISVSLGQYTLRAETAPLVVLSWLYLFPTLRLKDGK